MRTLSITLLGTLILVGAGCAPKTNNIPVAPKQTAKIRSVTTCDPFFKKPDLSKVPAEYRDLVAATPLDVTAGSRGALPNSFADLAPESTLCGTNVKLEMSYYISSLSPDDLFAFFTDKLKARGCTTQGVQQGQPGLEFLFYLPFSCTDGKGLVYPYSDRLAYAISFHPTK